MLRREVHLVKFTDADMRGSVEGQIKELIIDMTYKQPVRRIKIDALCSKLEGNYYITDSYQDNIYDRYSFYYCVHRKAFGRNDNKLWM